MTDPYQPPAVELEPVVAAEGLPLAPAGHRAVAAVVDTVLFYGAVFMGQAAGAMTGANTALDSDAQLLAAAKAIEWLFVLSAYAIGTAMEASPIRATPGKLLAGLRVVRLDGEPAPLQAVLKRNLLKTFTLMCCCWFLGFLIFLEPGTSPWDNTAATRVVRKTPEPS